MKSKILPVIMLILILINIVSVVYLAKPSSAEGGNDALSRDFVDAINEVDPPSRSSENTAEQAKTFEERCQALSASSKWNFQNTNEWSKFAYADGNKTRLIVGFNGQEPTNPPELEKIAAKHEAKIVNTVSIKDKITAVIVELTFASVPYFAEETRAAGLASYVEPNMKVQAQLLPNDPYWSSQWGPQKIEADWAWNTTVGDSSILVAVVDTGIYYTHPDLAANYVALGYDWINSDPDPIDDHGHGTHCAGIIAAVLNNGVGIAGLAQVRVMAEKVLDSGGYGTWDQVANGIINATDCGADIISMSLGGYGDSELVHEAVRYAYESEVLVIAAAGNDNSNMKCYPAAYDEVVAVAATDQYDNKAGFSNWGDWIELAAPGVDIYSTVPWGYDYKSGTSMACPHVSGTAALLWSQYPAKSRDWVRSWLKYTADDLGYPGFDENYGYGRINARKAVEQTPPAHELIALNLVTPPYVEPGTTATISATTLNFGENDETGAEIRFFANNSLVDSAAIDLSAGTSTTTFFSWSPAVEGLYNVTVYVVPVAGETNLENNMLQKCIYVGVPMKAVVLHSSGNLLSETITNWQELNSEWRLFGDTMIYIDYTTLNKESITYEDITSTDADVLIISCAYDPYSGWQFTNPEIEAITQYVREGHGLIATAGTFYSSVPNNNKLASLFGLEETTMWSAAGTDLLDLLNATHPMFASVPDPLVFPEVTTVIPYDGMWDSTELTSGTYQALGHYKESAIVTFRGLVYISPWLEIIPPYYHHHLQLLYNAITWSRYQQPQHELTVSLEAPGALKPGQSALLNGTVLNIGLSNETEVELQLLIDDAVIDSVIIPELRAREPYTLGHLWTPTTERVHNITAYAPPLYGEEDISNNAKSSIVTVSNLSVALFQNYNSWDYPSNQEALDHYGIPYIVYSSDDFGRVDLSAFTKVVIASDQDQSFYYGMDSYRQWFEDYASNGGILEIHAADSGWHGGVWTGLLPGRLQRVGYYGDYVTVVDTTHPLLTSPNTITETELDYWNSAVHGYFSVYPADAHIVIVEDYYNMPVYLEFGYGSGSIIASSQTLEWAYKQRYSLVLENSLLYMPQKYEHDLAVTLAAPAFLDIGESCLLNATVRNRGLNSETGVELQLLIDGTVVSSVLIPTLPIGGSYDLSYLWTPIEGFYNVTAYASPVPDEEFTANNIGTKIVSVSQIKYVLFDQTHATDMVSSYNTWTANLSSRGYVVETLNTSPITPGMLERYDVFVIPQAHIAYTAEECSVIQTFVFNGGGLLVIGDDEPFIYSDLTGFAGITWASGGTSGVTTDITPHAVTEGVTSVYLSSPVAFMYVTGEAQGLVRDSAYNTMLAVSEQPLGKVACFADEDSLWDPGIRQADNLRLANNMIDWLAIPAPLLEHDLAVSLFVPSSAGTYLTLINTTVTNRGLNNETNVYLYLEIDGSIVSSAAIPQLHVNEIYKLSFEWTPTRSGVHNITGYAPPVPGEDFLANNIATRSFSLYYTRSYIPHEWIGSGTPMGWHGDDMSWQYTLRFYFPFYGVWYNTIYISSNGLITFTGPDSSYSNSVPLLAGKLAIAPAWNDWMTTDQYDIYIWENTTQIGIRWNVRAYGSSVVANFEVVLGSEGSIRFNYEYSDGEVSATAGISNGAENLLAEDFSNLNYIDTMVFTPFQLESPCFLTITETAGGDTSPPPGTYGYAPNSTVQVFATPYAGYLLDHWELDSVNVGSANPYTVLMEVNHTVKAFFSPTLGFTNVAVVPNNVTVDVGNIQTINVTVQNVSDLVAYEIMVYYEIAYVNVTRVELPTDQFLLPLIDPDNYVTPVWEIDNAYNATHGRIWTAYSLLYPETARSGNGTLFTITFLGTAPGVSSISIDQDRSILANNLSNIIPYTTTDGSITVNSRALNGDANGDGVVNISDLVIIAAAFGSVPGQPRWNEAADQRRDNIINVLDLVLVAIHFGETYQ